MKRILLFCLMLIFSSALILSCEEDNGGSSLDDPRASEFATDRAAVSYSAPGECNSYHAGELWFDSSSNVLKVCDNDEWKPSSAPGSYAHVRDTEPYACSMAMEGSLWYNSSSGDMNICIVSSWSSIATGSSNPGDNGTPCTECIIFSTSTDFDGNLGGLEGADDECNFRAASAGLPGTYKAMLSTSRVNARDYTRIRGNASFVTSSDNPIAGSYDDLWDGTIDNYVEDEFGLSPSGATFIWTGSFSSGYEFSSYTCEDWTSNSDLINGYRGNAFQSNSGWFNIGDVGCNNYNRIYCAQYTED